MNEKYSLVLDDQIEVEIHGKFYVLNRVKAERDIKNPQIVVEKGTLGGYIYANSLDQEGEAWVEDGSYVGPGCFVSGKSFVGNNSVLYQGVYTKGRSYIKGCVLDPAFKVSLDCDSRMLYCTLIGRKGDVFMDGDTRLEHSTVEGSLSMHDRSLVQHCNIRAIGCEGISLYTNDKCYKKAIEGSGTIDSGRVNINPIKEKN